MKNMNKTEKMKSTVNGFNYTVVNPTHKAHELIQKQMSEYWNKTKYGYWDGYGGSMGRGKEGSFDQFAFVLTDKYKTVKDYFVALITKHKAKSNYKIWKMGESYPLSKIDSKYLK